MQCMQIKKKVINSLYLWHRNALYITDTLQNVGFMTSRLQLGQVRDIGVCLNWLCEHRGEHDLFGDWTQIPFDTHR